MPNYSKLLSLLRNCSDQSENELIILSENLRSQQTTLAKFDIQCEDQAEGIHIDLSKQKIKIFKTEDSAVKYLTEPDFTKDIIVIEEGKTESNEEFDIIYEAANMTPAQSMLFDNILYFYKFKSFLTSKNIVSYSDAIAHKMILLSSKHGRLDIGYRHDWDENYHNTDNDIKKQYEIIESKISLNSEFADFFRESFIDFSKDVPEVDKRFLKALGNIKHIIESANRNYELFKHSFSFSEFKKELDEDKEKHFKEYQSNLSDFLSKIASMPVQFGVYIFLIVRFSNDLLPIIATAILIFSWSIFKVLSVNRILENVIYLKDEFLLNFTKMLSESGISADEVETDKKQITNKFDKSIFLIKSYRLFVIIFSFSTLIICFHFIVKLLTTEIPA